MEKAPRIPEENQSSPESTPSKKRRSVREVVRDWLYYREFGTTPVEETEKDTDEGNEKTKKKNRFQKFFERLFSDEVSKEPLPVTEVSDHKIETPLLSQLVELEAPTSEPKPELPADANENTIPPVVSSVELLNKTPHTEPHTTVPDTSIYRRTEVTVPLHHQEESFVNQQPQFKPEVQEETTSEKDSDRALASATRGEYLSRKRDKKQQREIDHTKQELEKVQKLQEQTAEELQAETDRARRALAEKRAEVPSIHPKPELAQARTPEHPRVESQAAPESVKEILAKRQPEVMPMPSIPAEKRAEALAHANYEQLKPEVIQKAVEAVSEKNIAIEGLFERRHESKDETDFKAKQSASQGGVATSSNQNMVQVNPPYNAADVIKKNAKDSQQRELQYKKAAFNGVWAALILLIFLAILFFL